MKQGRIPRTELSEIRRQFARMLDDGVPAQSIMVALKLGRSTYFQWKKKYQEHGLDGLKVRPLPGAASKLTDQQTSQLRGWLVGRDPRQFQFDFALWTRRIVRDLIRQQFGTSAVSVGPVRGRCAGCGAAPPRSRAPAASLPRGRCAPPWTCEPLRPFSGRACGQAGGLPGWLRSAPEPPAGRWPPVKIVE